MQKKQIELDLSDFTRLLDEEKNGEEIVRPSTSFWRDFARRLFTNKAAVVSLIVVAIMVVLSIVIPLVSPYQYDANNLMSINQGPSAEPLVWNGYIGKGSMDPLRSMETDSLAIGFFGAIFPALIGVVIGGIAGYFGGVIDMLIMRVIDVLMCVPQMVFVILLMLKFGNGPVAIVTSFALIGSMGSAECPGSCSA